MLTTYKRNCNLRFGGVNPNLFLAEANSDISVTWSGDTVTAIAGSDKLLELQADINTVSFTSEGEWGKSGFDTQTLAAKFSKSTPELETMVKNLKKSMTCGLFAVYVDNNKNGWLVGLAPAAEDFHNDYFRQLNVNYATGESVENVDDGNIQSIELVRMSATNKYPISSAVTSTILDRTATFITFADA